MYSVFSNVLGRRMDISGVSSVCTSRSMKCVECMCLMTLLQEHISSKHSADENLIYFELSEWQQSGYKQLITWTLECDRCDFKTTNKTRMFEHIANHQLLEDTTHRINQFTPGVATHKSTPPSSTKSPESTLVTQSSHQILPTSPQLSHDELLPATVATALISSPTSIPFVEQRRENSTAQANKDLNLPFAVEAEVDAHLSIKDEACEAHIVTLEELDVSDSGQSAVKSCRPNFRRARKKWVPSGVSGEVEKCGVAGHARRSFTVKEKLILLDKASKMGASRVAKEFDVNRSMLQKWRLSQSKLTRAYQFNASAIKLKNKDITEKILNFNKDEQNKQPPPSPGGFHLLGAPACDAASHKCSWCSFEGTTASQLTFHCRLEHRVFICDQCPFRGDKSEEFENHMIIAHKSVHCVYCGTNAGNRLALRKHYTTSHGTTVSKCTHCSYTTVNKKELSNHFNTEHLRRRAYKCIHCDYITFLHSHLVQHILAVHEKRKLFQCPHCKASCSRKHRLKIHMKQQHNMLMTPKFSKFLNDQLSKEIDKMPTSSMMVDWRPQPMTSNLSDVDSTPMTSNLSDVDSTPMTSKPSDVDNTCTSTPVTPAHPSTSSLLTYDAGSTMVLSPEAPDGHHQLIGPDLYTSTSDEKDKGA